MVLDKKREERIQWLENHLKFLVETMNSTSKPYQEQEAAAMNIPQFQQEYMDLTGREYGSKLEK